MPTRLSPQWRWVLAKERNVLARPPVIADGMVLQVFVYDKKSFSQSCVVALDLEDGHELWRSMVEHVANRPVVGQDGAVFVSSFSGTVHGYDRTGQALWATAICARNIGMACLSGDRLMVAEIGGRSSKTFCLDVASGAVRWEFANGGHSYAIAANADIAVHATAISGPQFGEASIRLFGIDLATGAQRWSIESEQYLFAPVIVDDLVVIAARGSLRAYRLADGREAGRLALAPDVAIDSGPVAMGDSFVFGDDAGMVRRAGFSRSRLPFGAPIRWREQWRHGVAGGVVGRPVALGGAVLVLDKDGVVHRLDGVSGETVADPLVVGTDGGSGGGVAVAGDRVAVAQGRGVGVYRVM